MEESQAMGTPSTSNLGDYIRDGRRTWATWGSSRLSTELDLLLLWSWDCLCCLFPFGGPISPSSGTSWCIFLLSLGLGFSSGSVRSYGGGGGRFIALRLIGLLGGRHLVLAFMSSLKLWLDFWSHLFCFVFWRVLHVSYYRGRSLNAWVLVFFFLGL